MEATCDLKNLIYLHMKKCALVLMIVLLAVSSCKNFRKSSAGNIDTLFADTAEAEAVPIDSAALFEAMESYPVASTEQQPVAQSVRTPAASESGNTYFMIVGSFSVPSNAETYAAKIRAMGYNATILTGRDNLQMVSARSYASLQESIRELEQFRTEVSPDAWVYVRR
jgi:cell division protein FtsN